MPDSVWLPGVEDRRNASRTPAEANMNVMEWDGLILMELPEPAREGNHDISVLVAVLDRTRSVLDRTHSVMAVAEVELPCDGHHALRWAALRTTSSPDAGKLVHWETGIRRLLDGVFREDRGLRD